MLPNGMREYIAARIQQRPPLGIRVVPGSTPVVAFGDVRQAKVATLGWNPSKLEFLDRSGRLLDGSERRLETATSLKAHGTPVGSAAAVGRVFDGCSRYFQGRPYRRWFDVLEKVVKHVGASYYDGSACHLDLVQWATDPVWSGLDPAEAEALLRADIPFLRQQLAQEEIRLVLLNGTGIVRAYETHLGGHLKKVEYAIGGRVEMFCGQATAKLMVVGWNINLQSSFGVSNAEITAIGQRVAQLAKV
jgi:hypothetical protein